MYLTLTKDIKFHCPAGFNENIFACACKMIQEKVDSARQARCHQHQDHQHCGERQLHESLQLPRGCV